MGLNDLAEMGPLHREPGPGLLEPTNEACRPFKLAERGERRPSKGPRWSIGMYKSTAVAAL